jgi:hypothetical protein
MSQVVQRDTNHLPDWLVFSGVAVGVIGASARKHAESVVELVAALSGRIDSSDVAVAIALGLWGLVLLVAGAVVVLAGLVVIALVGRPEQQDCAVDPQRCSPACPCVRSAPSSPPELGQRAGGARAA